MGFRSLQRRVGGSVLLALMLQFIGIQSIAQVAWAGEGTPRVAVVPFLSGDGATEKQAQKFSNLLIEDLKTRDDTLQLAPVSGSGKKEQPQKSAPVSSGNGPQNAQKALDTLNQGQQLLNDLKFEDATATLQKGIDQMLQEPGYALYDRVLEAYISLAVAYFRTGDEKKAQAALLSVVRMDPNYSLPEGKYPPVFVRELDKMKRRADKALKGTVVIEAPMGATAYLDGRDLGMVPVTEENVQVGMHYVKVEGTKGERFGQPLDLKGSQAKVKAVFAPGPAPVVATQDEAPSNPMPSALLDSNAVYRMTQLCKAANADYAIVGYVFRKGDHQLAANAALFSAKRQAFSIVEPIAFDDELLTANVEAFKLADALVAKFSKFDAAGLPHNLAVKPATTLASSGTGKSQPKSDVDVSDPQVSTRKPVGTQLEETRKPVKLTPDENKTVADSSKDSQGGVRALRTRSVLEDGTPNSINGVETGPIDKEQHVDSGSGVAWWVWAVAGVAVVGAAGGTYYGVTQATKPVTGTISAKW